MSHVIMIVATGYLCYINCGLVIWLSFMTKGFFSEHIILIERPLRQGKRENLNVQISYPENMAIILYKMFLSKQNFGK